MCDATDIFTTALVSGTPISITDETQNTNYICVVATDAAGNTSYLGSTSPLNIDTTPPTITQNALTVVTSANASVYPVSGTCTAP